MSRVRRPRQDQCLVVWAVAALAACSSPSKDNLEAKRISKPPPVDTTEESLRVEVLGSDGKVLQVIDAKTLTAHSPDYRQEDRRAWKVATLVPQFSPGTQIVAYDHAGVSLSFDAGGPGGHGFEPVLVWSRRGDLGITVFDPSKPFPEFHGQGNRLARRGDLRPRLQPVVRLELRASAQATASKGAAAAASGTNQAQ